MSTSSVSVRQVSVSRVTVSTTDFQFSHGRMPRVFGCWAFFFGFRRGDVVQQPEFFNQMTHSQAKRAAVSAAAARGFSYVEVGS